ncbi:MAG: Gldg family protein, partial [Candidatus Poribacteria bacterium]|nr:Gldg family protein [Candidatus Poribacteria bacterium]
MAGKNVVGPLFGFLSLIFCFVSIASLFLKAWLAFTIFLIFCLISLAIFARLHFKEFVHFFVSRQLRYGTNVALSILGVIGIAVFVNVIVAQRFDKRVDLTELRLYSLSEQTKQILKTLNKKVDIIAFFSNEMPQLAAHAKEML